MWKAYNELGWSFAKIGGVFNRDPRSVKEAVETYISTRQETPEAIQQKVESAGEEEPKQSENKRPFQVLVGRDTLAMAAKCKNDLSEIGALDGAVYQHSGNPWPTDIPSVLHVSDYPEIKVTLAIEHSDPAQFLLLAEQLEPVSPGFGMKFREWEYQSLTPFVRNCQELIREVWYKAREGTGLEMSFDKGYSLPHEYGLLQNVPFFVYRFALQHCGESSSPEPELELKPADIDRFPYLPPLYRQLTPGGEPDLLLAAGVGLVNDPSRGITLDVMDLCGLVTIELCQLYTQDDRTKSIKEAEKTLKEQTESFREALADFLRSAAGG